MEFIRFHSDGARRYSVSLSEPFHFPHSVAPDFATCVQVHEASIPHFNDRRRGRFSSDHASRRQMLIELQQANRYFRHEIHFRARDGISPSVRCGWGYRRIDDFEILLKKLVDLPKGIAAHGYPRNFKHGKPEQKQPHSRGYGDKNYIPERRIMMVSR